MAMLISRGSARIALVHIIADSTHAPNHGLAAIAAVLVAAGIPREGLTTHVLDVADLDGAPEKILFDAPTVVLFSFMSNQLENVISLTRKLKACEKDVTIVAGGHHITAVGSDPRFSDVDLQVPGEVDDSIMELLFGSSREAFGHHQRLSRASLRTLDDLPLPQIDIFSRDLWQKYPSVIFSRGCPYKCSYCMSRLGGHTGSVRWKSPERAIEEIKQLLEYADVKEIYIDDDTLLKNPKWVMQFADLYQENVGVPFFCNARPETIKPYLVEKLKSAGCAAIGIGIESGSERIRRDILLRQMTNEQILRAFATLKDVGLASWSFNMIGIPREGVDEFIETVELNKRCGVDYIRASIFTEFPGMQLPRSACVGLTRNVSYIRSLDSLEPALRYHAETWLRKMSVEGRLWLTKSELTQLGMEID